MSGVHRLLTRRGRGANKQPSDPGPFGGVFEPEHPKKLDRDDEKKIKALQARLQSYGIKTISDANIEYALQANGVKGDPSEAFKLCILLEDTYAGLVRPYNPRRKLLGAVNRDGVTCYLDSLLFAMFARLDSLEAMLYTTFEDHSRKKLAGLIRLWVNLLRSGYLITTDLTQHLQAALAECGWSAAGKTQQQDTSEAFTFITGQLQLPLLTLKMDLFHTGKEDPNDDHKIINERLLEVAILPEPLEGSSVVTLEHCLEAYFNNRIEVKRHLERRRNTLKSGSSYMDIPPSPSEKMKSLHVETIEVAEGSESPLSESLPKSQVEKLRPIQMRKRTDSIFSQKRVTVDPNGNTTPDTPATPSTPNEPQHGRKESIRTEVLMPAWQFFKLLPWYTNNVPTSDAQVAAHFSKKRPVLGICLKRYSYDLDGKATRLDTFVDIPLEIAVPDFVSDDQVDEGKSVGDFRLVLQSVVCHRGRSTHSGHYVALVRGKALPRSSERNRPESPSSEEDEDPWMLFDDLAKERITTVDIEEKLRQECPYLLFYQVQPVNELESPPSYLESSSRIGSDTSLVPEKIDLPVYSDNESPVVERMTSPPLDKSPSPAPENAMSPNSMNGRRTEAFDWANSKRTSLDVPRDKSRGRTSASPERSRSVSHGDSLSRTSTNSITTTTTSNNRSVPTSPIEESRPFSLQLPSRMGSRRSTNTTKSRSGSGSAAGGQTGDNSSRLSLNISRIASRMSRSDLPTINFQDETGEDIGDRRTESASGSVEDLPKTDNEANKLKKSRSTSKHHHHHPHLSHSHERDRGKRIAKNKTDDDRDCVVM